MRMAKAVVRYLLAQSCLSAAVGFMFGGMMLAADITGIRAILGLPIRRTRSYSWGAP
jgi:hypothetical protein